MIKPVGYPARWPLTLSVSLLAAMVLLHLTGCSQKTVRVTGVVWRVTGNQMPSPDLPAPMYGGYRTHVYFFAPTHARNARRAGPPGFFQSIGTPSVAKAATDDQGRFRVRLPAGSYSVLIGRDSLFYTNIVDGDGILNPLVISGKGRRRIELKADWDARY